MRHLHMIKTYLSLTKKAAAQRLLAAGLAARVGAAMILRLFHVKHDAFFVHKSCGSIHQCS
ncbi:unnamed protein product [Mycetohabitans rhizoxinica HKI 454]|uniref:Uncharacterized protein n=1 Tax=Mycetohabitans rhizoxinica (strain DSM 19002 / CIP 109453 / HKI 454) TaxID=882378 RepID=E5AKI8_MYCRK|nr:unnamed protein product [Mycetohabitans rhizoxinica HKI 454]